MNTNEKIASLQVMSNEEDKELDEAIDTSLASLPLEATEQQLVTKIIESFTKEELQKHFELFNINQSKKNALRIIKLSNLLAKVEDQAIERFEKRPDQISNKELLEYMNVISNQIDRAQKSVDSLKDIPAIRITNQTNEVNINVGPKLDRDSKERVMEAISMLLKQVQQSTESEIIDVVDSETEEYNQLLDDEIIDGDITTIEKESNKEN